MRARLCQDQGLKAETQTILQSANYATKIHALLGLQGWGIEYVYVHQVQYMSWREAAGNWMIPTHLYFVRFWVTRYGLLIITRSGKQP